MELPPSPSDLFDGLSPLFKALVAAGTVLGTTLIWVWGRLSKPGAPPAAAALPAPASSADTAAFNKSREDAQARAELEARIIAAERENARLLLMRDMGQFREDMVEAQSQTRRVIYEYLSAQKDRDTTAANTQRDRDERIREMLAAILTALGQLQPRRR